MIPHLTVLLLIGLSSVPYMRAYRIHRQINLDTLLFALYLLRVHICW
jgi:hypothetical protein